MCQTTDEDYEVNPMPEDRFSLQVQDPDGTWRSVLSGDYTEWLQDQVSGGHVEPDRNYRCLDEITDCVVSEWDPDTQAWTELPVPWTAVHVKEREAIVEQTLVDEATGQRLAVKVECKPNGISLVATDHGDKTSAEGHGTPVWIEFRDGQLWVNVWADVNQEEPTHSISLEGAREALRGARPMFVGSVEDTSDGGSLTKFHPFSGRIGDRVLVGDSDPRDRYEGEIVDLIPAQAGHNGPMVTVRDDEGRIEAVALVAINQVYRKDDLPSEDEPD